MRKTRKKSNDAFTLAELLVATMVIMIAVVGILYTYARYLELDEMARNTTLAVQASHNKLSAIKNTTYANIYSTYNGHTFTATGINGRGRVVVDNTNAKLMKITVTFCWRQSNTRLFGEDANLNGALNVGEDLNGNSLLDSPVQLVSYIYDE